MNWKHRFPVVFKRTPQYSFLMAQQKIAENKTHNLPYRPSYDIPNTLNLCSSFSIRSDAQYQTCAYIYMFFFHLVLKLGEVLKLMWDKSEWVNRIKEWLNLERTSGDRLFQPFYSSRATSSRLYRTMFRVFRSEIVTLRFWSRIDINA